MREHAGALQEELSGSVWHLKRYVDGDAEHVEEFSLTLCFPEPAGSEVAATRAVAGSLTPCGGGDLKGVVELEGELTKAALRLEHADPECGERCVYRSERFVAEGDGQFRGVWMCGARTGRFSAAMRKSPDEPRKRKSACRRKADAEIKSKRFFNDLKDELRILDRLGWSEKRWKEESKLEKGRAILRELQKELRGILEQLGLRFHEHTPWLERVERGVAAARRAGSAELLRRLRAVDCSEGAPADDCRSDWHTLFEIQRHFCALPPFRATKYLEPSNLRHALRCAEVLNHSAFARGRYIGGARALGAARLPSGWAEEGESRGEQAELRAKIMEDLRRECIAGDLGVDEAYSVQIQLVVRAGCSEFVWEPGPEVKLHYEDRVYYEQPHVWSEERRARCYPSPGPDAETLQRRLAEFERLLTGGREDQVYEEDFEFVEMTARTEGGAAEGVPAFLEHSVTGGADVAQEVFERAHKERGWAQRPKALNLPHLSKTRLAGYRRQRTREIVWGPGLDLYWERGDRPLRLLRMAQEPVRVRFSRNEEPYGFHLQDLRAGPGGAEVAEVAEDSPADLRGVVVGRTIKRLCSDNGGEDVRQWTRAQIEEALQRMPEHFVIEFGKGDTEERRHAPLGDAEMAILMDERFMRGFLHELTHCREDVHEGSAHGFDLEGWGRVFPGLDVPGAACKALAEVPIAVSRGVTPSSEGEVKDEVEAAVVKPPSSSLARTTPCAAPPPAAPPPPPPQQGAGQAPRSAGGGRQQELGWAAGGQAAPRSQRPQPQAQPLRQGSPLRVPLPLPVGPLPGRHSAPAEATAAAVAEGKTKATRQAHAQRPGPAPKPGSPLKVRIGAGEAKAKEAWSSPAGFAAAPGLSLPAGLPGLEAAAKAVGGGWRPLVEASPEPRPLLEQAMNSGGHL